MRRFEDLDMYDDGYSVCSPQGYRLRWTIGVRQFQCALDSEGYTREELCNDFEIDEYTLMSKVTGRQMWTEYELDYLESYLGMVAPDNIRE